MAWVILFLDHAGQLFQNRTLVKIPAHAGFFPAGDHDTLAADAAKRLPRVFDELESMLQHGKYLQNADQVSIADLSLVCELTQLQVCIHFPDSVTNFPVCIRLHNCEWHVVKLIEGFLFIKGVTVAHPFPVPEFSENSNVAYPQPSPSLASANSVIIHSIGVLGDESFAESIFREFF